MTMDHSSDRAKAPRSLWKRLWQTRRGNLTVSAVVAALCAVALVVFHTGRRTLEGILPPCSFWLLTGFRCVGCGATRSLQCFLEGKWRESLFYNPLFFVALMTLIVLYVVFTVNALRPQYHPLRIRLKGSQIIMLAVAAVVFLVVRNTPWYQAVFY